MTRRQRVRIPNGVVLYDGPSLYDDTPIVMIATGTGSPSRNDKVGASIQIWVLARDVDPITAHQRGLDGAICGDCPFREHDACYVTLRNGVLQVWKAFHRGGYPAVTDAGNPDVLEAVRQSRWFVRGGAYGNHSAVPFEVTEQLLEASGDRGHCLYVHDWQTCDQRFRHFAMASVETVAGALAADAAGWRFYLSLLPTEADSALAELAQAGLRVARCPYRKDDPTTPQCVDCKLCDGKKTTTATADARAHIWNPAHGSAGVMAGFRRMRASLPVLAV